MNRQEYALFFAADCRNFHLCKVGTHTQTLSRETKDQGVDSSTLTTNIYSDY